MLGTVCDCTLLRRQTVVRTKGVLFFWGPRQRVAHTLVRGVALPGQPAAPLAVLCLPKERAVGVQAIPSLLGGPTDAGVAVCGSAVPFLPVFNSPASVLVVATCNPQHGPASAAQRHGAASCEEDCGRIRDAEGADGGMGSVSCCCACLEASSSAFDVIANVPARGCLRLTTDRTCSAGAQAAKKASPCLLQAAQSRATVPNTVPCDRHQSIRLCFARFAATPSSPGFLDAVLRAPRSGGWVRRGQRPGLHPAVRHRVHRGAEGGWRQRSLPP